MAKKITKYLSDVNSEASQMWAYDLNGDMKPDNVSVFSEEKAWFRCYNNPKHLFERQIRKMTSDRDGHNVGCKYCGPNAKVPFPGETDLFSVCPEAKESWDYEQNDALGLDPSRLLSKSNKRAHFICQNGHDEFRKIEDYTHSPKCQICEHSLLINAPNTLLFLNERLNTVNELKGYIKSDTRNVELKCCNCNYTWSWAGKLWYSRQYCPHCGYNGTDGSFEKNSFVKELYHITTLRDANPEMSAIWDYDKNGEATPDNVSAKTNDEYAFKCDEGHEYSIGLSRLYDKDGTPRGCPLCEGRKSFIKSGVNDFFTKVPIATDFWDFDNNETDSSTISKSSDIEANFKCNKGHNFRRKIYQFSANPKCPECRKIENAQKYSIKSIRPESYRFWNFDKNTLDPSVTSAYLDENAYWKCPDCCYEWEQKISDRCSSRAGKCPCHDLKRVFSDKGILKYEESFKYKHPEASEFWNIELSNGMAPENTTRCSTKEIYMNCSRDKHKPYPIKVCDISVQPYKCPGCIKEDEEENYKKYSLMLNVPCSKDMWDYDSNDMKLEDAKIYMDEPVKFICSKRHHFQRALRTFAANQDCPTCGIDSVARYPHLVKQWDFKKNIAHDIKITSANTKDEVNWKCKKCGYEWKAQIYSRKHSAGHCPCCEERVVVVKGITDLFTMVPDVVKYYNFEANKEINADELSVTSPTIVNWNCPDCGYKWPTGIAARIVRLEDGSYKMKDCPSCIGQIRTKSYGEEYPDLAERFVDELNGCSLYDLVSSKDAKKKYIWKCNICGETFDADVPSLVRARDTVSKGCTYCSGKKVLRENSFAVLHPEVMDEYDPENDIDPFSVTVGSSKRAKWICRNNHKHKWKAPFISRAIGRGGCNICRNYNYGLLFCDVFPEYEKYYDTEKNERLFKSLSAKSNDSMWWKCKKGHSFPRCVNHLNTAGAFICPICTGRTIVSGENDLLSEYPELIDIWDYKKNDSDPSTLSPKTKDRYFFTCEKGHSYSTYLNTLIDHEFRCFVCDNIVVQVGFNSLLDTDSDLCKEISPNESRKAIEFTKKSAYSMLWKCPECSGEYHAIIKERSIGDDSCPYCDGRRTQFGTNSLIDTNPDLAKELSPENDFTAGEVRKDLKKWAKWICPTCNGTYSKPICDREMSDDSCPYCKNEKLLYGFNGVAQTDAEAITEWIDEDVDPYEIFATSSIRVDWKCESCSGIYSEPINKHLKDYYDNVNDCPYCNNRKALAELNTLDTILDDVGDIWSDTNEKHYTELLPTSSYRAEWVCKTCGGVYNEYVRDFVEKHLKGEDECPYCMGKRPLLGYNTLKTANPHWLSEWSYQNNYLLYEPDDILPNHGGDVWWKCGKCGYDYPMSPKDRYIYEKRHKISCPKCKGLRRKKKYFF